MVMHVGQSTDSTTGLIARYGSIVMPASGSRNTPPVSPKRQDLPPAVGHPVPHGVSHSTHHGTGEVGSSAGSFRSQQAVDSGIVTRTVPWIASIRTATGLVQEGGSEPTRGLRCRRTTLLHFPRFKPWRAYEQTHLHSRRHNVLFTIWGDRHAPYPRGGWRGGSG